MDLRTDHPFWLLKNGLLTTYPPLRRDASCDVAVIGAGISGAAAAFLLAEAGVDVAVLDKRDVATGSTAASTGLLMYATDSELRGLVDHVGWDGAARVYGLGLQAIDRIGRWSREFEDDFGFERLPSLYMASTRSHVPRLREEHGLRRRIKLAVDLAGPRDLRDRFGVAAPAAIVADGDAQVDPHRLTHALLRAAARHGARVHDRTEVCGIEWSPRGVSLRLTAGGTVRAKHIVFSTGYETGRYLRKRLGALHTTYAFASEPIDRQRDRLPARFMLWESARPYLYLRPGPENRIIAGGTDTQLLSGRDLERRISGHTRSLVRRMNRTFPSLRFEVAHAWGGAFGDSKDGLPYIGRIAGLPRAYFALGYGGNGITFSVIAGQIIRDVHLGRRNADAAIFRFDR